MILSLRTGSRDNADRAYIRELTAMLEKNRVFDEVWLATSYGLPTVEECRKEAAAMAEAAAAFRRIGVTASMQVSRTVGHHPDSLKNYGGGGVQAAFDRITTIDGEKSEGVFCWNNAAFETYICEILQIYAGFQPHTVWVDDDVRLRLMGKSKALCFCDTCIRLFNEEHQYSYDRAALRRDFLNSPQIRTEYIAFQTASIARFVKHFSAAIHAVSPETVMALQNGGNTMLAVNAQRAQLQAMEEATGIPPAFRAGGGFYDDHAPDGMLSKSLTLNYMNARLPETVALRSCEIENLPFTVYGKSPECTCLEAALYIAYGCNSASVTLMNHAEPLDWHSRLFEKLAAQRPYFDAVVAHNGTSVNGGIAVYQPPHSNTAAYGEDAPFWNDTCIWEGKHMLRWGLPLHTGETGCAYLLTEKACDFLTAADMEFLTRHAVLTDGAALSKLCAAGYGDMIGAAAQPLSDADEGAVSERVTAHPVNGALAAEENYNDGEFQYSITGERAEPLARFFHRRYHTDCGCSLAWVSTANGGKWVISGTTLRYANISYRRRELLRQAIEAAGGALPAYVASPEQTVVIPRVNAAGQTVSVTLLQASLSDTEPLEVAVAAPQHIEGYTLYAPYGKPVFRPFEKRGDRYIATLPPLRSWRIVTILI